MKALRILFHMALADLQERTRRYSFLVMVGLVVYLGVLVNSGQITLRLGAYRGVLNSAWVGSLMTLVIGFFLGIFGFYLVNNSIQRDEQTGVGQIIATTPISRPVYTIGKWISNFVLLSIMVLILAVAAVIMQLLHQESAGLELGALLAPMVFVALPMMALVAALAILFESIPRLRGGLGNIIYFFVFLFGTTAGVMMLSGDQSYLDPTGVVFFISKMSGAAEEVQPDYDGDFVLNVGPPRELEVFEWSGIDWTGTLVAQRLVWVLVAAGVAVLAAVFFNRFDPSRRKLPKEKKRRNWFQKKIRAAESKSEISIAQEIHLSSLEAPSQRMRFFSTFKGELTLLLKGHPWWWVGGCGLLVVLGFTVEDTQLQEVVLPLAWVWPLLVWSDLGCRAVRCRTQPLIFSAPKPLTRQLPAVWLAGVTFTAFCGLGAGIRSLIPGSALNFVPWLTAVLFIPTLALALGIWCGTGKPFEVIYMVLWYLGPMSKYAPLDFMGATGKSTPQTFLLITFGLLIAVVMGRVYKLRKA